MNDSAGKTVKYPLHYMDMDYTRITEEENLFNTESSGKTVKYPLHYTDTEIYPKSGNIRK